MNIKARVLQDHRTFAKFVCSELGSFFPVLLVLTLNLIGPETILNMKPFTIYILSQNSLCITCCCGSSRSEANSGKLIAYS